MNDALLFTGLFILLVTMAALLPLFIYHLYREFWLREVSLIKPKISDREDFKIKKVK